MISHGKRQAQPGYKKLYVEKSIVPVYNHLNYEASSIYAPSISFCIMRQGIGYASNYRLIQKRDMLQCFQMCILIVMHLSGMGSDNNRLNDRVSKIYDHIVSYCKANDLVIILKNKMKYGNAFTTSINHDFFV